MNDALAPISIDQPHQESDARHEPPLQKPIDVPAASPVAPVAIIISQDPLPAPLNGVHEQSNTQLPDQPLYADVVPQQKVNGIVHHNTDVEMADLDSPNVESSSEQAEACGVNTNGDVVPRSSPNVCDMGDDGPPAKRARKYSDADQASTHFATPPPASNAASPLGDHAMPDSATSSVFAEPPPTATTNAPSPPPSAPITSPSITAPTAPPAPLPVYTGISSISTAQFRFMQSTIRNLKKTKDAGPFLYPVDPVKLSIPHYPLIVKTPMDFSTVERKLSSSNPAKPDSNPHNPRYFSTKEFIDDVLLIFSNCETFNGADHALTAMGKRVEESFLKSIKQMPPPAEAKPPAPKKITPPPPPPPAAAPVKKEKISARRPSAASMPTIRRSENEAVGRPKREIHPPPSKDLPYAELPKKTRKVNRRRDDGTAEQLKFCAKVLTELHRKQHVAVASPFYEPVDWVRLEIPDYPKVIKKPMDLSTMKRKLDNGEYASPSKFYEDFKLMIRNCFTYNPTGTVVNQAGIELQRLFDDKWRGLPPLRIAGTDADESEEEDDDEDRLRTIAALENQMETMKNSLVALKGAKPPKDKKKTKQKPDKLPAPSTSKAPAKVSKAPSKKKSKKAIPDDDVLSFEQKKDLSESITKLDGTKLEKVIQIIHEGVPEIKNSSEEIELEVDLLPAHVLTKLYNFVVRPMKAAPKRNRGKGTGTGTGGLKRKSMDEDVEAEKIRQLEERMALFEQGINSASAMDNGPTRRADSDSDSSSGSDSSGSDSE